MSGNLLQFGSSEQFKNILRQICRVLPHLCTLASTLFGFISLIFSNQGNVQFAAEALLLAVVADFCDGFIARFFGVETEFGAHLDSLSDAVSFCVAPAFMVYTWQGGMLPRGALLGVVLFVMCGLIRLARFNVQPSVDFFVGLPTTMAAMVVSAMMLVFAHVKPGEILVEACLGIVVVLALLMVSTIRFPSLKKRDVGFYKRMVRRIVMLGTLVVSLFFMGYARGSVLIVVAMWMLGRFIARLLRMFKHE